MWHQTFLYTARYLKQKFIRITYCQAHHLFPKWINSIKCSLEHLNDVRILNVWHMNLFFAEYPLDLPVPRLWEFELKNCALNWGWAWVSYRYGGVLRTCLLESESGQFCVCLFRLIWFQTVIWYFKTLINLLRPEATGIDLWRCVCKCNSGAALSNHGYFYCSRWTNLSSLAKNVFQIKYDVTQPQWMK